MPIQAIKQFFNWLSYTDKVVAKPATPAATQKMAVGIEFFNLQATKLTLWIELACLEVELLPGIEYRVESEETQYRIVFNAEEVILYLQYRLGLRLYQRPYSDDISQPGIWELVQDDSNFY
jgi:hypothetical protein